MTRTILNQQGSSAAMTNLALTFPTFHDLNALALERLGIHPWNIERLLAYARSGAPGSGARATCRFLLNVWNDTNWPKLGRFTLQDLQVMDEAHRAAFATWAQDPWFP